MSFNTTDMKKSLLILSLLIGTSVAALAQPENPPPPHPGKKGQPGRPHQPRKEKVEAMKIGFITNHLNLTPEEAQKFWPVYNEYSAKHEDLRKSRKSEFRDAANNLESLSDKEVEALVDNEIIFRQKEIDLQKEYHKQFKAILPIRKVAKLYRAEEMFKRELVKRIQERSK